MDELDGERVAVETSYVIGDTHCPRGSAPITSESTCAAAARRLGLKYRGSKALSDRPTGCFNHPARKTITWNSMKTRVLSRPPVCSGGVPAPAPAPGPSPDFNFDEWMAMYERATNGIPQVGAACGYQHGWCGCSCGNNLAKPCSLPFINHTLSTEGGHTCGYYGVLYGCAEAHNNVASCPRSRLWR